jgi:hypothetical protein
MLALVALALFLPWKLKPKIKSAKQGEQIELLNVAHKYFNSLWLSGVRRRR